MGYLFTLLYLLAAYLTPELLFGPLSDYHIEITIVLLATLFSIPNLSGSRLATAPQTLAIAGLLLSIAVSIAQTGWLGGVLGPLYGFMQPVFAFALVAVNCKTKRHLQWIILLFGMGSIVFMVLGIHDLRANIVPSPYLFGESGVRRLRGLGFVNDPNDFAQVLVSLIPAAFLLRRKSAVLNVFVIGIPVAVLVAGIYLTHSRGALLALIVIVLLAARRKIGLVAAAIISAVLLAGLFAAGFTGGRDVSMDAGADRLDLWYDGLETIKAHPVFGIGLNQFIDKFGITAHNSVIICASELGIVGLFFWVLFVFATLRMALCLGRVPARQISNETSTPAQRLPGAAMMRPTPVGGAGIKAAAARQTLMRAMPRSFAATSTAETMESIAAMESALILALAGLLTAGWFLSRALSMWLFMYCGMVYAVTRMNPETKPLSKDSLPFLARWSAILTVALLLLLYAILRVRNLVGQ